MENNKILILLPDGIGLRNFALTDFNKTAAENGFNITFWNNTKSDIRYLGLKEIKIKKPVTHPFTDILKRTRKQIEIQRNINISGDKIYEYYSFPSSYSGAKTALKSISVLLLSRLYNSERGLLKIRKWIKILERKTSYYRECITTLKMERPALVFCSNQRPLTAIAPMLAAQHLGIPTATLIFSWDNLPKATMVIETDYYFVWSSHMKAELLFYYPYIDSNRIFVTGTPQFETHADKRIILSRQSFFEKYKLNSGKKYICYSGDDITTSPNDPVYLGDIADAVRKLNEKQSNLGIIFRRCPVDFSDRFDEVLKNNNDIITAIDPEWQKLGGRWDAILPTRADLVLQMNTIAHTELVINVGSSMVFDYASHGKPCAYINYDIKGSTNPKWSVKYIYKFIHFRSMPDKNVVVWLNDKETMANEIEKMLSGESNPLPNALRWFEKINIAPASDSSKRFINAFKSILLNR